jgi:hypothetical protein
VTNRSYGSCFDRGWWWGWSIVACLKMSGPASACQGDALTRLSFEAHRLPLTILIRHPSPAMMIDLTGSEKPALASVWSASSPTTSIRHRCEFALWTRSSRRHEQPPTVAAALLLAAGPDDRARRNSNL